MKSRENKFVIAYYDFRRKLSDWWYSIWCRFFGRKMHLLNTGLTPARWYEVDTRMLHGMMELAKWFVENDMRWTPESYKEELERLEKEKEEGEDPDHIDGHIASLKDQWATDEEIWAIVKWWEDYPRRQEEIKSALSAWYTYITVKFGEGLQALNQSDETSKYLSEKLHNLEAELDKEEQEMLIRLVKVRHSMWS